MESIIKNAKPSATQEFQRVLQIKNFFDERFYKIEVIILRKLGTLYSLTNILIK